MAKIKIVNEDRILEVPDGTPLKDALKDAKILFGCTNGHCGVCCINVIEGAENLAVPSDLEKENMEILSLEPNQRLACQAIVTGDCTIEYINEAG